MGQFSWIAQDTKRSISSITPQRVVMKDNKGNKWVEENYQGYGVFGGKDFYQLLAEMNNAEGLTGDVDADRNIGISLYFSGAKIISPNLNEDARLKWRDEVPTDCPEQGWVEYSILK